MIQQQNRAYEESLSADREKVKLKNPVAEEFDSKCKLSP